MAKATVEKPTKVKKATKSTSSDAPSKMPKSLLSSVISESKPNASKAKPVQEHTKPYSAPSKKRKAVAEAAVADELPSEGSAFKAKKARRVVAVEDHGEDNGKVVAKSGKEKKEKRVKEGNGVEKKKEISAAKSKKKPSDEDEEAGVEAEETEQEEVEFFGFSTDDEDSSDEELDVESDGLDVAKLPTIAKDDAVVKRKLEKAKRKPTEDRGVIYLGRIPHGFYEVQMKAYFTQFGDVTRLRLSRSKKTGRSKHYAFIEFDSSAVAEIVADTMDNYLLMGHILTCKLIPKDEVHPELWVGANRKWRVVPHDRIARLQHNKARTEEEQVKAEKRLLKRQEQKKRKLAEAGIKYDFAAVAYKRQTKSSES